MKHRDIVLGLLIPTNENATEPIQPTVRPLHHPTSCLLPRPTLDCLRLPRLPGNVRCKAELLHDPFRLGVVVAVIQTHTLRFFFGRLGTLHRNAGDGFADHLHVGAVGSVHRQAHRYATALDQLAALDPFFGPIRGVFAGLFPPPGVPWSCTRPCSERTSRCPSSSHSRASPASRTRRRRPLRPTPGSGRGRWNRGRTW